MLDPDYDKIKNDPYEFCKRVAYHMGLPEDQYNRLTYMKFGEYFPDNKEFASNIRVDFDGGRPELHLVACPFDLTEEVARNIGQTFTFMLKRAVKAVEDGTWKKSGWIVV